MTDGTSQGLFVVVAIVIFGIFVALSYTVFGNDGLSGGIKGLFETSVEDTNHRLSRNGDTAVDELDPNKDYGVNLIDINDLGVYTPYHTRVNVVSEDEFYVTRNRNNSSGWIAISNEELPSVIDGDTYTVSGYLFINGRPITTDDFYSFKQISTYADISEFYVDDDTGYFESVQYNLWNRNFLHTRIAYEDNIEVADVLTFRHLRVEHGRESTNPHKPN